MKADSLKTVAVFAVLGTGILAGLLWMHRHASLYGHAEEVVHVLTRVSRSEHVDWSADESTIEITPSEFLEILKKPPWQKHGLHELYVDVPLEEGEFMWFRVNAEYHICLRSDAGIHWLSGGKDPRD